MEITPITPAEFKNIMLRPQVALDINATLKYFEPYVKQAANFAIAPQFWLIANQKDMTWIAASDNIRLLTPFAKEEWISKDSLFWMKTIHPEDQGFVAASISMAVKVQETLTKKQADTVRINIYCRMQNSIAKYRWVLIQFPKNFFDSNGQISSSLILTTDLTHLKIELYCMMTLIDATQNKYNYYLSTAEVKNNFPVKLPTITKREHEIILLMTKGLTTPEIAEKLFISYHTVENHKHNLRQKTNTKTSAELIHYIWCKNLL